MAVDFILSPRATLAFPHLDTPIPDQRGVPKYSCVLLFDKATVEKDPQWAKLKALVAATRLARWPDPKNHVGLRSAVKDGDKPNTKGNIPSGYAGHWVAEAGTLYLPQFAGPDGKALLGIDIKAKFYAGCQVIAQVNAYTYDMTGNAGTKLGLGAVQWVGDGKRLVERADVSKTFAPVPGSAAAAASGNGDSIDDYSAKTDEPPF